MKKKELVSNSKKETWEIAGKLLKELNNNNLIVLKGELGSGKTTFSQGVLKFLGAKGPFTSPTFVVMKKYNIEDKIYKTVYHLDCYRVGAKDILELGWKEIIENKNNLVLVEWPEKIESVLPEKYIQVELETLGEDKRRISYES